MPDFDTLYDAHFAFVWRTVRRLGVPLAQVDDAVQDVFLVVHRRLPEFEGRAALTSWLFAIARRVVQDYRRHARRKEEGHEALSPQLEDGGLAPDEAAAQSEALRRLDAVLARMDEDKREVFVLAELEQLAAPVIAEALDVGINTVYSRLRAARQQFAELVEPGGGSPGDGRIS